MRLEELSGALEAGSAVTRVNEAGETGVCVFLMRPIAFVTEVTDKSPFPTGFKITQPALLYCIPDNDHMDVIQPFVQSPEEAEATDWEVATISFSEFAEVV